MHGFWYLWRLSYFDESKVGWDQHNQEKDKAEYFCNTEVTQRNNWPEFKCSSISLSCNQVTHIMRRLDIVIATMLITLYLLNSHQEGLLVWSKSYWALRPNKYCNCSCTKTLSGKDILHPFYDDQCGLGQACGICNNE